MAGITTATQNPNAIATVVAARTLPRLKAATVAYELADTTYEAELAKFGDTVNVPIPADYSSNLIADGGTVARQNPSLGNAALVLNRHREITFEHSDINVAFATPDLKRTAVGQAIANMAEDIDEDLLSIYGSLLAGNAVGTYNTTLTEAVLDTAETNLFNQRVSMSDGIGLVLTGTGYSAIRQIARLSEADKTGRPEGSADAFVGTIKGMRTYRAQKTNVTSSTNRHGIAVHRSALLFAQRPLGVQASAGAVQTEMVEDTVSVRLTMSYDHAALGNLCTLDVLYGFVCGRASHGAEIKH